MNYWVNLSYFCSNSEYSEKYQNSPIWLLRQLRNSEFSERAAKKAPHSQVNCISHSFLALVILIEQMYENDCLGFYASGVLFHLPMAVYQSSPK